MQRLVTIFLFIGLVSCNDGDFEVPSFDFDETINKCGTYVLYRTNDSQTEAFILQLDLNAIPQEVGTNSIAISATNCNYRIFDTEVSADYFCSDVPPVSPVVIRNWEAVAGANNEIQINTSALLDDDGITINAYEHQIVLYNLTLESNGEEIIYETYEFGSFSTAL